MFIILRFFSLFPSSCFIYFLVCSPGVHVPSNQFLLFVQTICFHCYWIPLFSANIVHSAYPLHLLCYVLLYWFLAFHQIIWGFGLLIISSSLGLQLKRLLASPHWQEFQKELKTIIRLKPFLCFVVRKWVILSLL